MKLSRIAVVEFLELFKSHHHIDAFRHTTTSVAVWLMSLEALCLVGYLFAVFVDGELPTPTRFWSKASSGDRYMALRRFSSQEKDAVIYHVVQLAAMVAHVLAKRVNSEGGAMVLNLGVLMTALSISALIRAFIPVTDIAYIPRMLDAIKQIYFIAQQPDVLPIRLMTPLEMRKEDNNEEVISKLVEYMIPSRKLSPPPASFLKGPTPPLPQSVSHATLLEGDLRNETQPARNAWVDSNREPDSDSDSDGEDYVDLAGGIIPITTEDSDWSVVDA